MIVEKINNNRLIIRLDNNEVLSYFGDYESLDINNSDSEVFINEMLTEILLDYGFENTSQKFLVELCAVVNEGCEITVSSVEEKKKNIPDTVINYTFEFKNSEELTEGILTLYNNEKFKKIISSLYKMTFSYRLTVKAKTSDNIDLRLSDFCSYSSNKLTEAEYTNEHGYLLIKNNAIEVFGKAFSKDF